MFKNGRYRLTAVSYSGKNLTQEVLGEFSVENGTLTHLTGAEALAKTLPEGPLTETTISRLVRYAGSAYFNLEKLD